MCGIVGYAGRRNALPILLDGLKRLEYRGYDSAGVAIVGSGLQVVKDKGFIANLEAQLPTMVGSTGFAHTRWATHGPPSKVNAHPHVDCTGKIALARNGIIENYASLREKLEAGGHKFLSQTDTESLVHLIESYYAGNLEEATRKALHDARGSYAILAVHADEPGKVVGARNESPLVVGVGPDETSPASDVPALLRYTDRVLYVMDNEMVIITPKGVSIQDLEGKPVAGAPQRITWSLEDAEKGGFEHFMLKEIHEAPKAIHETLLGRLANLEVDGFLSEGVTSVKLVACGTSYHAALVGKYVFEELARIPASAELASEYRYSQGPSERPLVILISQSGETADTLGAAREARRRGSKTLGISNVHAEAYAAGELKHGPLALVTSATPVIAVAVQDPTYEKMRSNIGEVSARGSPVLAIGTEGDRELPKFVDDVFEIPDIPWIFSPIPVSVALQLFAYEVARLHDCPIDKPRNLAKSVTVE